MFLKRKIFHWSLYYFSFSHICDQVLLYTCKYILIYLWTDRVFICLFYLCGLGFLQPVTQRSKLRKRRLPLAMCGRLKIQTNIFERDRVTVLDLAHEKECHLAAVIFLNYDMVPKLFFLSSSCCFWTWLYQWSRVVQQRSISNRGTQWRFPA